MGIWSLKDLCDGEWGTVYLNGGDNNGRYYRMERGIMRSLANEMVCIASARLEWQDIDRYGEPLEEGEDMEDEGSEEQEGEGYEEGNDGSEGKKETWNPHRAGKEEWDKKGQEKGG